VKLPREQRVTKAAKIIGPGADRASIEYALDSLDSNTERRYRVGRKNGFYFVKTTAEKRNAAQLRDALRKVQRLLAEPTSLVLPRKEWLEELSRVKQAAEACANFPLRNAGPFNAHKARATRTAADLLHKHGIKLTKTRRGKFERLAAVLYGDEHADLFHYCTALDLKMTDRD
jgi:hypothetical protein